MISIDPSKKIKDDQLALVRHFFQQNPDVQYIEKNKPYTVKGDPDAIIQFTNPLVRAKGDEKKYYVIETTNNMREREVSNEEIKQRKGSYSNVRQIVASLGFDGDANVQQKRVKGKVVRVKNRSKARHANYRHQSAEDDYAKMKDFPHLSPEPPIEVKKDDHYTKSYTVMNELQGQPINVAAGQFSGYADTKILLDNLIIPMFESYQEQIAVQGKVHCDIKPENILAAVPENFLEEKCRISYLDFDFCEKIGAVDQHRGTPCYLPPFDRNVETTLTSARDMFALAMVAIEIINPDLGSIGVTYSSMSKSGSAEAINDNSWQESFSNIIKEGGNYYNLEQVIHQQYVELFENNPNIPIAELFYNYCESVVPQQPHLDLMNLLERMTHADADNVPTLAAVIEQLHHISNNITVDYQVETQIEVTSDNSSLNIAKALSVDPKVILEKASEQRQEIERGIDQKNDAAQHAMHEEMKENIEPVNPSPSSSSQRQP